MRQGGRTETTLIRASPCCRSSRTSARVCSYYRERYDDEDPVSVRTTDLETHVPLAESWSGTKRPNYFSGRLLSAGDLAEEQNYLLETHRRHLRTLHGFGIVLGLQVSADAQGETITIEPGLAIDARGREVQLNERLTLLVPKDTASPVLVAVEYSERFVDPVPVGQDATSEPSRIEEGCRRRARRRSLRERRSRGPTNQRTGRLARRSVIRARASELTHPNVLSFPLPEVEAPGRVPLHVEPPINGRMGSAWGNGPGPALALRDVRVQHPFNVDNGRAVHGFEALDEHAEAVDSGDGDLVEPERIRPVRRPCSEDAGHRS